MVPATVAASLLFVIGLLHSVLGERFILEPLWARTDAQPGTRIGLFSRRTLRIAWHLTTLTLWAMGAAVLVPERAPMVVAAALVASGVGLFAATRGAHFAWPLFLVAGYASASAGSGGWWLPGPDARAVNGVALTLVLGAIALLHVYWAAGGRRGIDLAVPTGKSGARTFTPGPLITVVVAMGLAALAALPWLIDHTRWGRIAAALAALVFALRVVGDLRVAGVLKRVRGTPFARADDLLYSPLCFALSAGLGTLAAG